ncbi:MAG: hypothetical protein PWQ91_320 [Eubacteriales bacterium]|nr:hypothetical protein [Eubacteriales bacterium]MDN5363259.1 hypothetical protein [Eubacteriales bacterium]
MKIEIGVLEFIGRLTNHIPKKNFKMVRRYGPYRRDSKQTGAEDSWSMELGEPESKRDKKHNRARPKAGRKPSGRTH